MSTSSTSSTSSSSASLSPLSDSFNHFHRVSLPASMNPNDRDEDAAERDNRSLAPNKRRRLHPNQTSSPTPLLRMIRDRPHGVEEATQQAGSAATGYSRPVALSLSVPGVSQQRPRSRNLNPYEPRQMPSESFSPIEMPSESFSPRETPPQSNQQRPRRRANPFATPLEMLPDPQTLIPYSPYTSYSPYTTNPQSTPVMGHQTQTMNNTHQSGPYDPYWTQTNRGMPQSTQTMGFQAPMGFGQGLNNQRTQSFGIQPQHVGNNLGHAQGPMRLSRAAPPDTVHEYDARARARAAYASSLIAPAARNPFGNFGDQQQSQQTSTAVTVSIPSVSTASAVPPPTIVAALQGSLQPQVPPRVSVTLTLTEATAESVAQIEEHKRDCPTCYGEFQAKDFIATFSCCDTTMHVACTSAWLNNYTETNGVRPRNCMKCRKSISATRPLNAVVPVTRGQQWNETQDFGVPQNLQGRITLPQIVDITPSRRPATRPAEGLLGPLPTNASPALITQHRALNLEWAPRVTAAYRRTDALRHRLTRAQQDHQEQLQELDRSMNQEHEVASQLLQDPLGRLTELPRHFQHRRDELDAELRVLRREFQQARQHEEELVPAMQQALTDLINAHNES